MANTFTSLKQLPDKVGAINERLLFVLTVARARGIPQWKIAADADVHPTLLSLWAHGHRSPSPAQAARVAEALGYPVEDIFPAKHSSPLGGDSAQHRAAV